MRCVLATAMLMLPLHVAAQETCIGSSGYTVNATTCAPGGNCQTTTTYVPPTSVCFQTPGSSGGGGGGGGAPAYPATTYDGNQDGKLDCWKRVTSNGSMASPYGPRNVSGGSQEHEGIDVHSNAGNYGHGAPIRAVAAGTVSQVGSSPANGNFVRVNHDDGRQSTYIHLLGTSVSQGSQVDAGDQIGTMNCTGNCYGTTTSGWTRNAIQGTHLHLQIYQTHSGNTSATPYADTVDPVPYLGGASCS